MMKQMPLLCIACIFLAGCALRQPYTRPKLETTGVFGRGVAASADSIADLHWKEIFTDSCLQALIEKALQNNNDLSSARSRVRQAQASLEAAGKAFHPSLSLSSQGSLSRAQSAVPAYPWSILTEAGWEADIFARLSNSQKQAAAALEQSEAYRQAVQSQLVASIANAYCQLLMLDAQLEISRETLGSWSETLRTLELQKETGQATAAAVSQAAANKLEAEASTITLQQQITTAENSLCILLGQPPAHIARSSLGKQRMPHSMAVGAPLQLLSRRPDVKQAEAALAQSFYGIQIARAAFYPSVTLSGSAGWSNNSGGGIANPAEWQLNSTLSLVQLVFNKGKNKAALEAAQAQYEENLALFRQSLIKAGAEVNNALAQGQAARQRLEHDAKRISQLQQAVDDTKLLLEHSGGSTTYLEVLTAQQSLLQARLTEAEDRFSQLQAIVQLYQALGGGA